MKATLLFFNYITHEKRYSPHTVRAYTDDINAFCEFLKAQDDSVLLSVTANDIRSWVVCLAENDLSARSYKRKLSSIKAFYKFLLREGLINQVPTEALMVPKHQNPLPEFYSPGETVNLFENIIFPEGYVGERDKLILMLFYLTGIRLSELVNLKLQDVDFSLQHIKVTGKRNKQRTIPLSKNTLESIAKFLEIRKAEFGNTDNSSYLFLRENGERVYPRLVQRITDKYFSQVTTSEKTNPHKLRHTFATHMLNNGADLNAVKELLGHASLAATEVYTHNTYEKLKSVYKQAHPRA
jgi:integrase/recombinase XerC